MQGNLQSHQNATYCMSFWPTGSIFLSEAYITINSLSSVVGTLANCILLAGLYKSKQTHQNTMRIIFSLACSDFGVSALVVPTYLTSKYYKHASCAIHVISTFVFFSFAINTANMLLILSLDRVLQISWPIVYRVWVTRRHVTFLIITAWFISPSIAICVFFTSPLIQVCVLFTFGMTFYVISVAFYARILFVIRTHKRKIRTDGISDSKNESLSITRKGKSKKITFKLQVEVFDVSPTHKGNVIENPSNACNTAQCSIFSVTKLNDLNSNTVEGEVGNLEGSGFLKIPTLSIDENMPKNCQKKGLEEPDRANAGPCEGAPTRAKRRTVEQALSHHQVHQDTEPAPRSKKILVKQIKPLAVQDANKRLTAQSSNKAASLKREIKVTFTVAIVIITLFICYVPYIWSALWWVLAEDKDGARGHASYRLRSTYAWTMAIAILHSSVNPIIVLIRNKTLRNSVKNIFNSSLS